MSSKVNENSPEFISRYNQLKALVAEHFSMGKIPNEMAVSPSTRQFLEETRLNPISAIEQYIQKKKEPALVYYGYELSVNHRNKFLCLTEYNNQIFFGVKSPTKKEARTACAMRCLDYLIGQDLVEVMKNKPKLAEKKINQDPNAQQLMEVAQEQILGLPGQKKKKPKKKGNQLDFAADDQMDKTKFDTLNPTDTKLAAELTERWSKARDTIWEMYCNGVLHNRKELGVETVSLLQSSITPATQTLIQYCQRMKFKLPVFFIFQLPIKDLSKYICVADFEDQLFVGMLQPSKTQAKVMTSAVVIDDLITKGRFELTGAPQGKKRKAGGQSPGLLPQKDLKKLRISINETNDNADIFDGKKENLDPKTIFYLVMNPKDHVALVNEFCAKNKLEIPLWTIDEVSSRQYLCTVAIPNYSIQGHITESKKVAKSSAARMLLDALVRDGRIKVENPGIQPLPSTKFQQNSPIFDFFKKVIYDAFEEAYKENPVLGYSDAKIAGCFLLDSIAQTGFLVSWATGSSINPKMSMHGEILNDCYAEVLCRRSLLRFLYHQIKIYAKKPENSVLVLGKNGKLVLRPNFSFHFYMSHAPTGDAIEFLPKPADIDRKHVSEYQQIMAGSDNHGSLSIKSTSNGETMSLLQISPMATVAVRLSMSSSDKILKWNSLGFQGALLSIILEPIYFMSYTVEYNYDAKSLARALCGRATNVDLPGEYKINKPYIASVDPHDRIKHLESEEIDQRLSVNWNAADASLEVLNCNLGKRAIGGPSRLSRQIIFEKFCETAKAIDKGAWLAAKYNEAKQESYEYQKASSFFKSYLFETGLGQWVDKSVLGYSEF